jgi:DHA1 family bicyclomycin/chloramphenicol resistance-like MFS transporter
MITRRIAAPAERVLDAASSPIPTGFADPVQPSRTDNGMRWTSEPDVIEDLERIAEVHDAGESESELTLRWSYRVGMPYFGWFFAPLIHRAVRASLVHMGEVLEARALGREDPPAPRRPVWLPRDRTTRAQAGSIATICAALVVAGFGGSLFTQALPFLARSFHASDADLGVALSVTRVGTLVGLVGSALADRRGRRRILLASVVGVCVASALSALTPDLVSFAALQVIVRGFVQLATIVGYIAVTEESPEGSRAFLLAFAGMSFGAGFAIGAALVPIGDIAAGAWRIMFAVAALGLLLVPGFARRMTETKRYAAMSARAAAARGRELVDQIYGRRFSVVAGLAFLLGFFGSPSLQFTNQYLSDVRGYSGVGITLLRAVTQALPGLVAIVIGGKLAESSGRKPVAVRATLLLAGATVGFFLLGGPALWMMMLVGTVAGALGGPAMTTFTTELFPTEVRGRAGAALLGASVAGAVAGLLLVGYLADPLGDVGKAVAVTCVAPVIVALFLVPRLPEGGGRALDELSPPEV